MAITNHERVTKALTLLKEGLRPFVERELQAQWHDKWLDYVRDALHGKAPKGKEPLEDLAALLELMWEYWNAVFRNTLGRAERNLVSELRDARNDWAHQQTYSTDNTYRALDSAARLLTAIAAPQAADVEKMKNELLRLRYEEQNRAEKRKIVTAIESEVTGGLKPWREVATPHHDVASGRYQQAEFAADLWQVHLGEGADEYRDPAEFFRRTFLTDSLTHILNNAIQRMTGNGGEPVIQLQTNFGGGKTHSMLALYHLFSGVSLGSLHGMDELLQDSGKTPLPEVRRVVLVGNKISPGNPSVKADGTVARTLWGELAWQLGGRDAYERIRLDDERATNPGDALRELFNTHAPCLILIDEWVAYARQLHEQNDLPAGNFETHFSFAQTLAESAKAAPRCLVVISLPASDSGQSVDDVEVGGERGRTALDRLRNAIGRVEASWRPASAEEGFEIVRRRLFEPLTDQAHFTTRDTVADAFYNVYRSQAQEFPPECREAEYKKRLKAAYPIHPEIFDRLYGDWSTLLKFQRTRGVLRLMAAVIHSLWSAGDRNPLILPCNLPIDDPYVRSELTRYLADNWTPIIEKDVDGPGALPRRIDADQPNLGKYQACCRVARTIYLGSAPMAAAANRGIEDRRVKLGCVMPGESPSVFGDALRRLSSAATYLYQDATRYWYATQPTVTKLADDRAEQLTREPERAAKELDRRLRSEFSRKGEFAGVHVLPQSGQDVPDSYEARLVVLSCDAAHDRTPTSPARAAAQAMLESRGAQPRLYRNTLLFLACDKASVDNLDDALRRFLAWESIIQEKTALDLSPHQVKQAEAQREHADNAARAKLPEAYKWLLMPTQAPGKEIEWQEFRLNGAEPLAERASKKLCAEELLVTRLAGTQLRQEMDRHKLWRGHPHVAVKQLLDDFPRYLHLMRVKSSAVLLQAIRDGLMTTVLSDSFAYADHFDEASGRYLGLMFGRDVPLTETSPGGLLVMPDAAQAQFDADRRKQDAERTQVKYPESEEGQADRGRERGQDANIPVAQPSRSPKRFHGAVALDPLRVGRDAGRIAEEVIAHLTGLPGARVTITLEIEADLPEQVSDSLVRIITENARTLKFTSQGFENE